MQNKLTKLGIYGASGAMGARVSRIAKLDESLDIVYEYSRRDGNNNIRRLSELSDIIIDFSTSNGSIYLIEYLLQNLFPVKLLICSTGFSDDDNKKMLELSKKIPILYASNTSLGANLLIKSVQKLVSSIKNYNCDIDIIEAHHKNKIDIPSGTALSIAKAILDTDCNYTMWDMLSRVSPNRQKNQIIISSLRMGENPGEHEVIFSLLGETIKIKHSVHDKDIFAFGSINLAKWFANINKPGLYSIGDFFDSHL